MGWGVAALTNPNPGTTVPVVAKSRHWNQTNAHPDQKPQANDSHHSTERIRLTPGRRSRQETKDLMIDAGAEVLLRDGIGVGASTFRYRDAFAQLADQDIKVTRGSIHQRIWSSQVAWQLDVLSEVIERNDDNRRRAVTGAMIMKLLALPVQSVSDREFIMAEAARLGGLAFIEEVQSDPSNRLFPSLIAAWKASNAELPEHERLGEILCDLQEGASERLQAEIGLLVQYLDLRPHPDRGLDLADAVRAFCASSIALSYSHAIRLSDDPRLGETIMARCPDGVSRPWNLTGLGNWLIGRALLVDRERTAVQQSQRDSVEP